MKVPPVKLISDWIGGAPAPRIGTRSCAVPTLSMIASTTPLDTYQSPMPPSASVPPKRSAVLPEVSCRAVGSAGPPHSATVVRRRAPVPIFIEDLLRTRLRRRAAYLRRALRVKGRDPEPPQPPMTIADLTTLVVAEPVAHRSPGGRPRAWRGSVGPSATMFHLSRAETTCCATLTHHDVGIRREARAGGIVGERPRSGRDRELPLASVGSFHAHGRFPLRPAPSSTRSIDSPR